ncbi:hypothetical protein TWF788_000730 [Orbilia oligospora]|uniref:Copper acquisition factor BIM1-like domain-containing protein n=1 Tax=Orbilia oligospora TaxID=2813651 RepID=A0A7C8KEK2_ORBOL|nr:hypothetical protein TWF788_000730 [Orbilia oligospora]
MLSSHFFKLVGLASLTSAHFFLETPIAIGFDDLTLTEAPCGGFDPTDRSAGVTEWPVLGYPIALITTHLNVNWTFRAALLSDVTNWVDIFPRIHQTGIAEFCLPEVPGIEAWIGQDAVVQIIQEAPDGLLHQCAAVKFVAGGPAVPDDTCDNDPMISLELWLNIPPIDNGGDGDGDEPKQFSNIKHYLRYHEPSTPGFYDHYHYYNPFDHS